MDFFESFKKWEKEELGKYRPSSNKKRKRKKNNNSEKNKFLLRLKHKSKYLSIEMEILEEELSEAKQKMFASIIEYCANNPNCKNPLVADKTHDKPEAKEVTDSEADEVKSLYREIAKVTHPDLKDEELTEMFISATEAKETNKIEDLIEISFDLDIDLSEISIDFLEKIEKELCEKEKTIQEKRKDIALQWSKASKTQQNDLIKLMCPEQKD